MEKAVAPHSSTLAWKIPWTEEPGRLYVVHGVAESDLTEQLHFHFSLSCLGEGNGNPLQYSCLENPRDGQLGRLPSMGSHRVRHDWSDLAAAAFSWVFIWAFRLVWYYNDQLSLITSQLLSGSRRLCTVDPWTMGIFNCVENWCPSPVLFKGPLQYFFLLADCRADSCSLFCGSRELQNYRIPAVPRIDQLSLYFLRCLSFCVIQVLEQMIMVVSMLTVRQALLMAYFNS